MDVAVITEGLQFPEGPVALSDGSVLVVEIQRGTLTRVAEDGTQSIVAELGGGPNGAALGPDGHCYICNNGGFEWHEARDGRVFPGEQPENYTGGRIERVNLDTGSVETLYEACNGERLKGPNDLVFDQTGGFWFTDHGKTRPRTRDRTGVFYAAADGSRIQEVIFPMERRYTLQKRPLAVFGPMPLLRLERWTSASRGECLPKDPISICLTRLRSMPRVTFAWRH
jgi:gluconolactonase